MTASTLSPPREDGSMSWMTELKRDRFVFVGWSGLLLFPTAYMAIGGWAYWHDVCYKLVHSRVGVFLP